MVKSGTQQGALYDMSFLDASGAEIGLVLTRNRDGIPNYKEYSDPAIAQQLTVGQAGYGSFEPMKELQFGQNSYEQGFGAEYMDYSNPRRYYTSQNCDLRFKNQAIAGAKATAASIPTYPTISGTLLDSYATNWTYSELDTNTKISPSQEAGYMRVTVAAVPATNDYGQIYQDAVTWTNAWRGVTISVSVLVNNSDVANVKGQLIIDDGIGTTTSSSVGSGAWETVKCTRKLDVAATRLRIICRALCVNTNGAETTDFYTVTFPIIGAHGSHFEEFDDDLFFSSGSFLFRVSSSTGAITLQAGFPHTIQGLTSFSDGYLYIFHGSTSGFYYYYMSSAEVVTITNSVKDFACRIGDTMYAVDLPYSVHTATNPTADANWSAATTVGSITDNITAILGVAGIPYVIKEDMPYYIDTAGDPQELAPQLRAEKSSTSGTNTIEWQGNLYIPCGAQTLYEYDTSSSVLTDISPSKYITNSDDFDGQIQAISADAQYLYIAIDNSTSIEILAGRWETISGSVQWVWHPLNKLTLAGCAKLYASSVYKRRLWVASTSSSDSLYYYPLTYMYGNILADSDYSYSTGTNEFITPYQHLGLSADQKGFYKITLTMRNTSTGYYWKAYYEKLGDTSWTQINSTGNFQTSPTQSAYLPVDSSTQAPYSEMMRFKFSPHLDTSTGSPVMLNYDVRAWWFPYIKKVALAQVRVADQIILRNGQKDEQGMAAILTAINGWLNPAAAWPRAFYPPYWASASDTVYAKLLPTTGGEFLQLTRTEEGKLEYVANLTILICEGISF